MYRKIYVKRERNFEVELHCMLRDVYAFFFLARLDVFVINVLYVYDCLLLKKTKQKYSTELLSRYFVFSFSKWGQWAGNYRNLGPA